jgi:serine/threonine protein phosphatase PrpC
VRWVDFEIGDLLLIGSDGLNGVLSDEELAQILPNKPVHDLSPICDRLIKDTRAGGAPDNVTVVLVQIA